MKILLISHNALTSFEAMGKTLLSLLDGFEQSELCQFYIYPSIPNVNKCQSYYRITDKDVLNSFFHIKRPQGSVIAAGNTVSMFENKSDELLYRKRSNKRPFIKILRDLMWKTGRWNTGDFNEWLTQQKPDCIFAAPGGAKFLYDIAMTVSGRCGIPVVSYLCDEYYFVNKSHSLSERLCTGLLKKKIDEYMKTVSAVISISPELTSQYSGYFHKPVTTVMTGVSFPIEKSFKGRKNGCISFFGNVRCNRYVSLVEFGKELERINKTLGLNYVLKIYTAEKNSHIISQFQSVSSIELCGFVTGSTYSQAMQNSEYLLHVEAFDADSIDFVKNSVSTKLADYLGSGIPLIAYGPSEVASIKHLVRNDCAFIIKAKPEIFSFLSCGPEIRERERVVVNALKTAELFHNPQINNVKVREIFEQVTGEKQK